METAFRNSIVHDLFADECEIIGSENVDAILSGPYQPVRAQGGENMAVAEIIGIVVSAVEFIDTCLSVYKRLKSLQAPGDSMETLVTRLRYELRIPEDIDDERVEEVLRRVARHEP